MCPPRIMLNDSTESNVEAPGRSVHVSLPALMISLAGCEPTMTLCTMLESTHGSTCSFVGYGPMPKMPFSLSSQTFTLGGRCSGTSVGIPTPKLT